MLLSPDCHQLMGCACFWKQVAPHSTLGTEVVLACAGVWVGPPGGNNTTISLPQNKMIALERHHLIQF